MNSAVSIPKLPRAVKNILWTVSHVPAVSMNLAAVDSYIRVDQSKDWDDGSKYTGQYHNGQKHGKGMFVWPEGSTFEGEFKHNSVDGVGTFTWKDGRKSRKETIPNRGARPSVFLARYGNMFSSSFLAFPQKMIIWVCKSFG